MAFFDTHIHLTDFKKPLAETLQTLENTDVLKCVCVSAQMKDWENVAQVSRQNASNIIPAFGLHPWYITKDSSWREKLRSYINKFKNAALGECGFDKNAQAPFDIQKEVFEYQLELAHTYQRPLILHIVKSENQIAPYFGKLPSKSVFHSFSGSVQMLNKLLNFGYYISVNKRFFNKKNAVEILRLTPIDNLLIETDAPFQSEPSDLNNLVLEIAKIKQEDVAQLTKKLYKNATEIFCYDK